VDDSTFEYLMRQLKDVLGVDLQGYKMQQMRRRLTTFIENRDGGQTMRFVRDLGKDEDLLRELRDMLTINVTEFYRDSDQWTELRGTVMPELVAGGSRINIWSAGCSFGQEPYSLAMILDGLDALDGARLLATDFDRAALARARAGGPYSKAEVKGMPEADLAEYFTEGEEGYIAVDRLRRAVRFKELNLLRDQFDFGFDMIVCRNVTIYFEADVKSELMKNFASALKPGGILFIGATEALLGDDASGFARMGGNFYRWSGEAGRRAA
jgi:chemotaxis protein methyltransferase CheR